MTRNRTKVLRNKTTKRSRTHTLLIKRTKLSLTLSNTDEMKRQRHFHLNASMVERWVTASKSWDTEINQNCKRIGSDQKAFYPEAEGKLYVWLIEQRKQGLAVTYYTILRIKMQEILKEPEMTWISSFMKRYKLSWRRRTKIFQKLPSQTEESLVKFHQFIHRLRTEKSFDLCNIFNIDETPVWFDMAGNFTVSQNSQHQNQIYSGFDMCRG
ncbi:unnamed protein product [Rhizophagus irregularis]|nr:unnamed protein product [Rhizophagus irregularis]